VVSDASVVIAVLDLVDVVYTLGDVSPSSTIVKEEVETVLEREVTIVVLGDWEALDVSGVSLGLVEGSWVVGMANLVEVSVIVAVAKFSVIPSAVVGANVENSNTPDTVVMFNVSREFPELLEVCVEDTEAIGVEEDFLSASVVADIVT